MRPPFTPSPFYPFMSKLKMKLLEIIESKIKIELRTVDQKIGSQVRELWSSVTPAPTCPAASEVMKKINKICHVGMTERGKKVHETVITTLKDIEQVVNKRKIKEITEIAKKHFPENQYVSFAESTKGVYERQNAPPHKYSDKIFEHGISLVKCGSANLSRQAIFELKTSLEEIYLKKKTNKESLFSRLLKSFAIPAIKWTFTIIASVMAVVILYILGIKG